jgi:hypothetical protein
MGLFDFASSLKSGPKFGRTPPINPDNTMDDENAFKVKTESKDLKQQASNPNDKAISKIETARLNEGVYKPTTVQSSSIVTADYYRRGKLRPADANSKKTFIGDAYDYMPRFLQDPEVEEISTLRLVGKKTNSSTTEDIDLIPPYSKFFLESYSEGHTERSQIIETFGDAYIFFFGERPAVYTFNGTLLNTKDINWKEDFLFYYNNFLRGTKAVEYKAKVLLTYGLNQIEGYVMGINMGANAANEKGVQLSFQMFVTKRRTMRLSVDFGIVEDNGKFNEDSSIIDLLTRGISDPNVSSAHQHASDVNKLLAPPSKVSGTTTTDVGNINKVLKTDNLIARNGRTEIA